LIFRKLRSRITLVCPDQKRISVRSSSYRYGFGSAFRKEGYSYAEIFKLYPTADIHDEVGRKIWDNGIPTIRAKAALVLADDLG
jgi:hypothetical protein